MRMKGTENNYCYGLLLRNICCSLPTFSTPDPGPTVLPSFSPLGAAFKEFATGYCLSESASW